MNVSLRSDLQRGDFPPRISLALARAAGSDRHGLAELTTQERALLCRILRNVEAANPQDSVRISNLTLGAALGCSERTIRRVKAGLVDKGWIRRSQQQSRRRGMQISDVWLSFHALETLGLAKVQRRPKVADACLTPQSFIKRQLDTEAEQIARADTALPTSCAPPQEFVPPDLVELRKLGISVPGIRMLMGLASRAGTRLGTVLRTMRKEITASRSPFPYLRALLARNIDWNANSDTKHYPHDNKIAPSQTGSQSVRLSVAARNELIKAMTGKIFSHSKRKFAWCVMAGIIHVSPIADAAKGGIGKWISVSDTSLLVRGWKEGKVFEVDKATLAIWSTADELLIKNNDSMSSKMGDSLRQILTPTNTYYESVDNSPWRWFSDACQWYLGGALYYSTVDANGARVRGVVDDFGTFVPIRLNLKVFGDLSESKFW